jgi:hypothetical protein
MCISATAATVISAIVGAGAAAHSADQSRKAAHSQLDQQRALTARSEAVAAGNANYRLGQRRRALSQQSLVTGAEDVMSSGILNGGKPTLGG